MKKAKSILSFLRGGKKEESKPKLNIKVLDKDEMSNVKGGRKNIPPRDYSGCGGMIPQ